MEIPSVLDEKLLPILDKVTLDPDPIKAVYHYYKTKFEGNLLVKPEWDAARITPATELVSAKRDLLLAERSLQRKREEQNIKREFMDKEWRELLEKEIGLRTAFVRFNKFIKENLDKRERAEKRVKEEKDLQNLRDQELEELQGKVDYMKFIKDDMEKHVNEYKMYENYLKLVINLSNEMNSSYDILNRYETLASARTELAARQEKNLTALETARTDMIKLTEEKSQTMMGLITELSQLQMRYDRAKAMSLRWETVLTKIKNISAEKALELNQVKISCWNLYTAMCLRKNVEVSVEKDNVEEQLVFIKRSIQELKKILRLVQKKAAKEIASNKPSEIST
ncbi:coiled-coil domain-containing protein, putative [Pediculus humanus corporis]|uniref:Coiled-coil domain-containing protein, putative n=1 Tax=Pediculus humanus subsp. corporis TaxID=121224 RepID=E0VMP3_PEDHC|nr:coiled-coil domain-containing protein, putative [Pediculus humanus corporis]EEB14649.1 coiled-coil domain-containing protein, putative [Pediculus humanus corporis]